MHLVAYYAKHLQWQYHIKQKIFLSPIQDDTNDDAENDAC